MAMHIEPTAPSVKAEPPAERTVLMDVDQRVFLRGTWEDFESMLAIKGDEAKPRIAFLDGVIELMSPSANHESVKTLIGRLIESYADERGIDLNGYGSWTLKNKLVARGIEPDECYSCELPVGDVPQLAIEVVWTRGGLNRLEIYRGLGVGEVWYWEQRTGINVYVLRGGSYEKAPKSHLLPDLDLGLLQSFLEYPNHSQAAREFRKALRG